MSSSPARRPWLAALLALLLHGAGHVYAGRLLAGAALLAASLALHAAWTASLRAGALPSFALLALVLGFWVAQAAHAARAARAPRGRLGSAWRAAVVAGFLVAGLAATYGLRVLEQAIGGRTAVQPTAGMAPAVAAGETVVVLAGGAPARGRVVLYRPAPGATPLLGRVVGLAGDAVAVRDGALVVNGAAVPSAAVAGECRFTAPAAGGPEEGTCVRRSETLDGVTYAVQCAAGAPCGDAPPVVVPPGAVYVLGDFRDHAAAQDSRGAGPIPLPRLLGRAAYVCFARDGRGVRWERLGQAVR